MISRIARCSAQPGDVIGALRSNAGNFPQPMRLGFDDVEHLGPKAWTSLWA